MSGEKITAATPTGPASGPRPTSSTPATMRAPPLQVLALELEIRAGRFIQRQRPRPEPGEIERQHVAQQIDEGGAA